jgi:drug/metabolite transporter (DMT)-like permease
MPARTRLRLFDDRSPHVDRFGALLTLTAIAVVTLSLTGLAKPGGGLVGNIGTALTTVIVGVTLLLALRASGVARRWLWAADVLVGVLMVAALFGAAVTLAAANPAEVELSIAPDLWVVLSVLAPAVIVRRLLQHREVTTRTLAGAISAYLLIPVAFQFIFLFTDGFLPNGFFGTPRPPTAFMYFSLTTVTTVGYGDLAPAHDIGRLLATVEALIGQVFLVTFVALLVGLLGERWRVGRSAPEKPDEPDQ